MAKTDYLGETGLEELMILLKRYVDASITSISFDLFEIVDELPTKGESNKVYLVPSTTTGSQNIFTEYIWVNNDWEKLGEVSVNVDLSDYVKEVVASGDAPLTLSASISGGVLTIRGSVAEASTTAGGYMSSSDKTKLDSIDTSTLVQSATGSGTSPLVLGATITDGMLTITGSILAASSTSNGYMTSEQYTQLMNLVDDPLQYAEEITADDVDAMWEETA